MNLRTTSLAIIGESAPLSRNTQDVFASTSKGEHEPFEICSAYVRTKADTKAGSSHGYLCASAHRTARDEPRPTKQRLTSPCISVNTKYRTLRIRSSMTAAMKRRDMSHS